MTKVFFLMYNYSIFRWLFQKICDRSKISFLSNACLLSSIINRIIFFYFHFPILQSFREYTPGTQTNLFIVFRNCIIFLTVWFYVLPFNYSNTLSLWNITIMGRLKARVIIVVSYFTSLPDPVLSGFFKFWIVNSCIFKNTVFQVYVLTN